LQSLYQIVYNDPYVKNQTSGQDGEKASKLFSGRIFALVLIGIASLYVLIMICQAYLSNKESMMNMSEEYPSEYEYQTESYDFRPYESMDTANNKAGFKYNMSINDLLSENEHTGDNIKAVNISEMQHNNS